MGRCDSVSRVVTQQFDSTAETPIAAAMSGIESHVRYALCIQQNAENMSLVVDFNRAVL